MTRRELLAALSMGPLLGVRSLRAQANDLTALTLAEASAQLANRTISPLQLTNAYLARIATENKTLNAYLTVTAELARRDARDLPRDGRLYGIPIAHKDLFETKDVRTTAGSLIYDKHVPDHDAAIVDLLARAGAVTLGKTNTHELGGGVTTINPFFGTTRNPLDTTRIAGGSSGGSAAAVVARLCLAATGSDTGGSVRIPAAFCGVVGFKPTFGKFSTQGLLGASPTFDHVGFLTRSVEDMEILVSALAPGTRQSAPARARVGIARNFFFEALDPVVANAVDGAIESLRSRAHVDDIAFPIDATTMSRVFDPVIAFEIWGRLGADWRTNPALFSKSFSQFFSVPRPSVTDYETALSALKEYQAGVDKLFDAVDVVVTPTVPVTAPPIGGAIDGAKILRNTWPLNAAGTPTISVPVRTTGMPVGLQLVARRGDDDKLLQIVRSLF